MGQQPNIILLTIDALRADHLGHHGYDRDTSPFLDSLAARATSFTTAISASSHTREALPALLSGRYPDVFAANGYQCVTETIADQLSKSGYQTAGFHSNPYMSRAYSFDSGFDTFDDDLLLGKHRLVALAQRALNKFVLNRGAYHVRAAELNDRSTAWLDSLESNRPFFLWNHYMDPHGPYNPPEGHIFGDSDISNRVAHKLYQKIINQPEKVTDDERRLLIDCYDGEIRYLDRQLERFFEALEERDLVEDSLIVVTADHGEAFGEHGYYTHPRYLYEHLLHVPLLLSKPSGSNDETLTFPVSTLDIAPTMLDCANESVDGLSGVSLLNTRGRSEQESRDAMFAIATGERENEGIRRFAIRDSRWKVVVERDIDSGDILNEQAYDLQTDPDEREGHDLNTVEITDLVAQVRTFSASRLESIDDTSGGDSIREESAEIDERLEALGYK